ncbi:hypothetical protein PoB_002470800 [Plakobranchus ocellatus]|uniref:Uncharacterized protein n=1 Tax=Plakobranchus ocellatus TaxID=259542 RepID=A0AAV3ZUT5_9GAST|nr:hypothetical protein PoB_002470800 [Plakobranchus ocellatus]
MRVGAGNGLSMEFDVQFDEYLPSTTASGLNNGEVPFPADAKIMAGTGAVTSVAIKKVSGLGKERETKARDVEQIGRKGEIEREECVYVCVWVGRRRLSLVSPRERSSHTLYTEGRTEPEATIEISSEGPPESKATTATSSEGPTEPEATTAISSEGPTDPEVTKATSSLGPT